MLTYFTTPVRVLLLAAVLALAAQTADARSTSVDLPRVAPTARTTARTQGATAPADGVPVDGVLIIIGIVGVVIALAWVCSRVGDTR